MRTRREPKYAGFGAAVQRARTHRQLTQAVLARRLCIGQQALSRWERGTSRPESEDQVLAIAAVLPDHDAATWLKLAGYGGVRRVNQPKDRAVRPFLTELPFDKLPSWEVFQDFCSQLLRLLYPAAAVHAYGTAGDPQRGVDIEVRLKGRALHTFQCKQAEQFGAAKVRDAIHEHKVPCALAVILLSRVATAKARDEVAKKRKKKWQLWDAKDISERVKTLPLQDRLRLVDAFFPGYREDFLGIRSPSAFEAPEEYFAPLLSREGIFSHRWDIIGRASELAALTTALKEQKGILLVSGPGGIGKTRLIKAAIDSVLANEPAARIHVLPSGAVPEPKHYEAIGEYPGIVIIEDAHDRLLLRPTLHSLMRARAPQAILITCRSFALERVRADIAAEGAVVAPGFPIALGGLTKAQAQEIATQILAARKGPGSAAPDIAAATYDSPLALVVGASLVAMKRIHPRTLNNVAEFRKELMARFRDAITGSLGLSADEPIIRAVLEIVSLVQPVEVAGSDFAELVCKLTRYSEIEVNRALDMLAKAGVLSRKARKFRVVPDVLGDYLLEETLGRERDLVDRMMQVGTTSQISRLLINTAKIDWRLSASDTTAATHSDFAWRRLYELAETGSPIDEKINDGAITRAYYRPRQALTFYDKFAARNSVPPAFSKLLRHVAMNVDYTVQACQRLLDLSEADQRSENAHPDQPMRVLKELIQIEPDKPVAFCEVIADFAIERIQRSQSSQKTDALFEVLRSALQPDGHTTTTRATAGLAISITNFAVRLDAVRKLRERIIGFLLEEFESSDPRRSVLAASVLGDSLRGPRDVSADVRVEWARAAEGTLGKWHDLVVRTPIRATTAFATERAVGWYARRGESEVADAAGKLLSAIPRSLEYRVTLAMADPWGHTQYQKQETGAWLDAWRAEQEAIAADITRSYETPDRIQTFLRSCVRALRAAGLDGGGGASQLIGLLAGQSEEFALALTDACLVDELLHSSYAAALLALMNANPVAGVMSARTALKAPKIHFDGQVSWVVANRLSGTHRPTIEEFALLNDLLSSDKLEVLDPILRGLSSRAAQAPSETARVFLNVRFDLIPGLIHTVFMEVTDSEVLLNAFLHADELDSVLDRIGRLPSIDDHWLGEYLAQVAKVAPEKLIDMLLVRIDRHCAGPKKDPQPFPYGWESSAPFKVEDPAVKRQLLRRIAIWLATAPPGWSARFWASHLFNAVARPYDESVVLDLIAWAGDRDKKRFDILLSVLREAPPQFATQHVDVVVRLFDLAAAFGAEAVRDCRSTLFASAISGMRHGAVGQPFPEDISRLELAKLAQEKLARGTAAWEFYGALADDAGRDIRAKAEDDQALLEEYE